MATYTLTTPDLNNHVTDATSVVNRVYTDNPITYQVKEIVVTDTTGTVTFTTPPVVTIGVPDIVGGIQATASASIINRDTGAEVSSVVRIVVTNPGSGYTAIPTVTVGTGNVLAVAVIEIDYRVTERRTHLINSINAQIVEEATHINTAAVNLQTTTLSTDINLQTTTLSTDINLNTTTIEAAINSNTDVLAEIRDEFDVTLTDNIAAVVQNIDNSSNDLLLKGRFQLTGVSGNFVLGEVVSTSTASGHVVHFDNKQNIIVIGYISGVFQDNQTLTGATASATLDIPEAVSTPASNDQIARGMMMINLKATNKLNDLRSEVRNPTSI